MKKPTSDKLFLDTDILIYAFSSGDDRTEFARVLLANGATVGVQSLNEFAAVARRKLGMTWKEVSEALAAIQTLCPGPVPVTMELHSEALRLAERYRYTIFDSLIIAAALAASSSLLFSEDLRHGQVIDGLTIKNPFRRSQTR